MGSKADKMIRICLHNQTTSVSATRRVNAEDFRRVRAAVPYLHGLASWNEHEKNELTIESSVDYPDAAAALIDVVVEQGRRSSETLRDPTWVDLKSATVKKPGMTLCVWRRRAPLSLYTLGLEAEAADCSDCCVVAYSILFP